MQFSEVILDKRVLHRGTRQFLRFGVVGVANTGIDLFVTNMLVLLFTAESRIALLCISLIACLTATGNSYVMNRQWTFRESGTEASAVSFARFVAISLMAAGVNTSMFLYSYHILTEHGYLSKWFALNAAKLIGICVAVFVSFVGYKIYVFGRPRLESFRAQFRFQRDRAKIGWAGMLTLLVGSAVVRLAYLHFSTAITGDAVGYGVAAQALAEGHSTDAYWTDLFTYGESGLLLMGVFPVSAAILVSFIPGVLLVAPVTALALMLYGVEAAWIAGGVTVVHPRLVESSCNGYADSFYLLLVTLAVYFLTLWLQSPNRKAMGILNFVYGGFLLYVFATRIESTEASLSSIGIMRHYGHVLQQLPGVFLTPMIFFALLLPCLVRRQELNLKLAWPLIALFVLSLSLNLWLRPEAGGLLAILVPTHIFGAAGLMAFGAYLTQLTGLRFITAVLMVGLILFCLPLIAFRGIVSERQYQVHRETATWLRQHVPLDERLFGDEHGYLSATAMLSGHRSQAISWSRETDDLLGLMRAQHGKWLIVYERFLKIHQPELLPILDKGVPGMQLRFETKDVLGNRVQVYEALGVMSASSVLLGRDRLVSRVPPSRNATSHTPS